MGTAQRGNAKQATLIGRPAGQTSNVWLARPPTSTYGEPRRSGPATGLPFESAIELVGVIWHLFPARVMPVQEAIAQPLSTTRRGARARRPAGDVSVAKGCAYITGRAVQCGTAIFPQKRQSSANTPRARRHGLAASPSVPWPAYERLRDITTARYKLSYAVVAVEVR